MLHRVGKSEKNQSETLVKSYHHILLTTDFSPHSELVAQRALELSSQYGAQLEVLHILEAIVFHTDYSDPVISANPVLDDALMLQAEENLRNFVSRTGLPTGIQQDVQWGRPKMSIISWAQEHRVDLIVMGSHGHHGFERLLGSVISSVLHQSSCDVLVVKK